ncbi:MAG: hypothetical protein K9N23_18655, partial [Akkermansiaceae bacterium]|nr:hypothetical protein [Akkermansiaceae bacterium]
MDYNSTPNGNGQGSGGVGQFAIGTFTASGSTQSFTLVGAPGATPAILTAIQVRQLSDPATIQLTITPNASTPGNFDFEWDSQEGKLYDLVSATDLTAAPDTWPVYLGNENIPGTAPTNTLTGVPGSGPTRFFAVVEKDLPPLLSE